MTDLCVYGKTSATPTAGTAVATLSSVRAGRYVATVATLVTGTETAATDTNNVELKIGSTVVTTLLQASAVNTLLQNPPITIDVPTGTPNVTVTVIANAGTSAVYSALLILHPEALF